MNYTLMKEAEGSSEASVTSYQITRQLNPKYAYLLQWLPQISLSVHIFASHNE